LWARSVADSNSPLVVILYSLPGPRTFRLCKLQIGARRLYRLCEPSTLANFPSRPRAFDPAESVATREISRERLPVAVLGSPSWRRKPVKAQTSKPNRP
jgi:hypothetical protein